MATTKSTGKKRAMDIDVLPASTEEVPKPNKIQKIHPFFTQASAKAKAAAELEAAADSSFTWLPPLGSNRSCLHGVHLTPKASTRVAAFDLDGTLIKSELRNSKGSDGKPVWEWWHSCVLNKLKEVHADGYAIVLISNQGIKPALLKTWKEKIPLIAVAFGDIPFRIFAATLKDQYRKPMPGMWAELERIFKDEGITIDKSSSFFVGDAAGRQYPGSKGDFASTDRKWALNIEIKFYTPEEYFLKLPPHQNYTLPGFHVSSLPNVPHITPTSTPLLPDPPKQEVVVFVGYPSLGKSSFYRRYFEPAGYVHINQDQLKTRDKCLKVMQERLKEGKSCVVDNTNRNVATRKGYIDACKKVGIPIRCFNFTGSIELAWHNNLYRAFNLPPTVSEREPHRDIVPYGAYTGFRDGYEEPTTAEGFSEMKKVNWMFEGSEEERKYWSMWLQIDGK
ncbi:polynucleotide kinase 3 phosphatase-domain-containing protein [Panaeolus papilionaceus]|nr:polynucleotide kinase 3 phosphatase-domain-containing protein [Panaeolus papilionaceus]